MCFLVDAFKSFVTLPLHLALTQLIYLAIPSLIIYFTLNQIYLYHKRKQVNLSGKTVLVTGAGNGFGREVCLAFAEEKCNVICVDLSASGNKDTIEKIEELKNGVKTASFICDVSNAEKVKEMGRLVYKEFENIDILVNNAGIAYLNRILDMEEQQIRAQLEVNLMSHFWMIKTFLPQMVASDSGVIIATSSILSRLGIECSLPYCTSKSAVTSLMESLKQELIQMNSNVKTLSVHPGCMSTSMLPSKISTPGLQFFDNMIPFYVDHPRNVAKQLINAVKEDQREVYIPNIYVHLIRLLNCLPYFLRDFISKRTFKVYPYVAKKQA